MKFVNKVRFFAAAAVASLLLAPAAQADGGFYLGGSIGEVNISQDFEIDEFDESATAWKIIGGYMWDLPLLDLGAEISYNDFGSADQDIGFENVEYDATGISAFGVVGVEIAIVGIFAKVGFVAWDTDVAFGGLTGSDDGTDPAYGLGLRLNFSSLEVRAEYELFDIDAADDVDMLSLGVVWRF
jgi:hypothetical protein